MERQSFTHAGLELSFLDFGGTGRPILALHAHWMDASTFSSLSKALAPKWRVLALDQRGHGYSGHPTSYTRPDYIGDLEAWVSHLDLGRPFVLLGHSLGGVNAMQFAARHPSLVLGLIVEDIGCEVHDDAAFILRWAGTFPSRAELESRIGPRFLPYLASSVRQTPQGWTLAFNPHEIIQSQKSLRGNYWQDWLATDCPVLLVRGADSRVTSHALFEQMMARRSNVHLISLPAGHVVHMDDQSGFDSEVAKFLGQF